MLFFWFFFFNFSIYLFLRDRDRAWAGEGEKEGETQNPKQALGYEQAVSTEPDVGLKLTNCETMTWAEVGSSTDWAPQALVFILNLTEVHSSQMNFLAIFIEQLTGYFVQLWITAYLFNFGVAAPER